ncbi:signal peptide peptidase SppA [Granulosicoccus antarcticus]|uniref:Protease 4 n=1 Tax=Granulosicoccus antarcticus IMCC3135 TaxID=1192854 RepID=A0A2Z2NU26_9GAMM|nr:signal peptide peptidase SppA [Granulosicoccus antarcticus]ASJ74809.1 Protease 4 [Granulosicoccus antarcticus IMCC3135]
MSTGSPKKRGIVFRFFRFLWRSVKAFNTLVFSLVSLFVIAVILYAAFNQRGPKIPTGAALLLNPAGNLVEQQTVVDAATLLQGNELPQQALVKDLLDALAMAKDDNKIELVVLDLSKLERGLLPTLESIATAIADFKTSGKKVIAVAGNYSQSAIFLAAHADEVLLNPEGMAVPEGFSMYSTYFKSFLEEQDVTVNLFKVGKYKSAVDPFLRDDMSEEDRTARMAILDAWWEAYTVGVETARGMEAGSINALLQNAPEQMRLAEGNLARLSLEKGFVDRLVTDNERRDYLIGLAGEDKQNKDYRRVAYKDYLRATRLPPEQHHSDKVAVITAVGDIVDGNAPAGEIGSQSLSKLIRKARLDSNVKAIVLRIDSGGGSKTASEVIRSELQAAQDSGIPVVASMGSVAASGGYWIAASADEIWASPTTVTGSIGIFGLMPSVEKTLARYGIYSDGVATTPIAGGASFTRGISPAYGEVLQAVIEGGYQQFLTTVAEGRGMDVGAVNEVAQGRIWTGKKAKQLGLVDELGDQEQAISAAARLADVKEYSVIQVEPELSVEEILLRRFSETIASSFPAITNNPVSRLTNMVRQKLGFLGRLNDPNNAYVICSDCPVLP